LFSYSLAALLIINLMDNIVAVKKCADYNPCGVLSSIEWLYKEANGPDPAGKKILLKPNILSDDDPARAVTTHPAVVGAMVKYLRSRGAQVFAGDSPTFDTKGFTGYKSGIRQAVEENGGTWVRFNEQVVNLKVGNHVVKVASIVKEVDLIINMPKLKTHELMFFTGAIKNIFGVIPSLNKVFFHTRYPDRSRLAAFFCDLEEAIGAQFHIMDAIVSMEGPGPGNGYPRNTGLLMASANPLALDIIASRFIGYNPEDIPTNRIALEKGRLPGNATDITVKGVDIQNNIIKDFKRISTGSGMSIVAKHLRKRIPLLRRLDRRPIFNPAMCTGCLRCIKVCPVNALKMHENKKNTVIINDNVCIRCFCCHELCRDRAIDIRRKLF